jgi:hypothetical protein
MSSTREWLRSADPVGTEPPLAEADAQRIRHRVIAEADARDSTQLGWRRTPGVAAAVLVTLVAAFGVSRWLTPTASLVPEPVVAPARTDPGARQLLFVTRGGTRVIWVFNATFEP